MTTTDSLTNHTKQQGFTLFELAVVAVMLGVVALFLLDRMLTYQEIAIYA